jgi:gp32 DNA binding protein like
MQDHFSSQSNTRSEGGNSNPKYYAMGKVEIDSAITLRFLPDLNQDNPMGFLKELVKHNLKVNGQDKRIPCLEQYGEICPICEQAKQFFNANQNALGSMFWKKKDYVAQCLIIDDPLKEEVDPANPIKLITLGKQILSIIKEAVVSGEIDQDPDAYKGGYNFIIKKTKGGAKPDGSGNFPTYNVGTRFTSKQSDLPDELIEVIAPSLINLDQLVPTKPDINSVTADLQAALVAVGAVQPRVNQSIRQSAPAPQAQQDDYSNPSESQDATPKGSVQDSTAALLERLKRK